MAGKNRTGPRRAGAKRAPGVADPGRAAPRRSRRERASLGKQARQSVPLAAHADPGPSDGRDPIGLVLDQADSRVPDLVPIRHGRMLVSPFTFFRGAAAPMAADLAGTPTAGLRVQLCGDAHLSNFGIFASPERSLVFDVNDFDETLPGPFEWDVKRLAASLAVAGRENGFSVKARRKIVLSAVASYREAMRDFAAQPLMKVWYAHLSGDDIVTEMRSRMPDKRVRMVESMLAKARTRDSMQAVGKLTSVDDGHRSIRSDPPSVVPIEEVFPDHRADQIYELLGGVLSRYRRSMQSSRRRLLEQFRLEQVARKVVGVGSVGTRAWIILLDAGDGDEPLFLQAKEAQVSVLAPYCGRSRYANEGERVVAGQHLIQAESDIFLGWTHATGPDGVDRDFYVRQLRDWKFSLPVEQMRPLGMRYYAAICGWTLARGHARSGDRIAIAAYLGKSDRFDQAVADFAEAYADRTERDYTKFQQAVSSGRAQARTGV